MSRLLTPEELEAAIREVGAERYHDKHPFHRLLHGGKLDKGQVQAWALNRYCYQAGVPRKDAALMSRVHDRGLRREWVHRILDHDGAAGEEGGIERWLVLTDALGLDRDYVVSMRGALPATRFAVEAYVAFVRQGTLLEAVASSLTELFAPAIHRERIAGMLEHYDFIGERAVQYFRRRLDQANRDADFALDFVKRHAPTPGGAGVGDRRRALQVRRAVGPARRAAPRLRRPGPRAAGCLPSGAAMSEDAQLPRKAQRAIISGASKPAFPRHMRLQHHHATGRWVIQAPERIFWLDDIAVAVLQLCDGTRSVEQIAEELAASYNAPRERILADIVPMLQDLADKGVVRA